MADAVLIHLRQGCLPVFQRQGQGIIHVLSLNHIAPEGKLQKFPENVGGLFHVGGGADDFQHSVPGNQRHPQRPLDFLDMLVKLTKKIPLMLRGNFHLLFYDAVGHVFPSSFLCGISRTVFYFTIFSPE